MDNITPAQLNYIEILIEKDRSCVAVTLVEAARQCIISTAYDHLYELSKKEASSLINYLKEK